MNGSNPFKLSRKRRRNLLLMAKKTTCKPPKPVFPIDQLPQEILSEIFIHCRPDPNTFLHMVKRYAPLLLCQICRSWRILAHSIPQLWDTLLVYFSKTTLSSEEWARYVDEWLERSGALPLTLQLRYQSNYAGPSRADLVEVVLKSFCRFKSRWESLEIDFRGCSGIQLPDFGELPRLRSFCYFGDRNMDHIPFSSAPRLTCLAWPSAITPLLEPRIPWIQLTHLYVESTFYFSKSLDTIRSLPELEEYTVANDMELSDDPRLPFKPAIVHPKLRKLHVTALQDPGPFLNSLTLPALTDFCVDPDHDYAYDRRIIVARSFHEELFNFFTRSQCQLTKLFLRDCGFNAQNFLRCLEHPSCETITELVVENVYNQPMFTDHIFERLTDIPDNGGKLLCPNLSRLQLEMCLAASPGALGRMVLSRCTSWDEEDQLEFFSLIAREVNEIDDILIDKAEKNGCEVEVRIDQYSDDEDVEEEGPMMSDAAVQNI